MPLGEFSFEISLRNYFMISRFTLLSLRLYVFLTTVVSPRSSIIIASSNVVRSKMYRVAKYIDIYGKARSELF